MANLEGKTAELLMGSRNPNHPEEKDVRLQEIKQLKVRRDELESEIAELRCASRELNNRLVDQARTIETEKYKNIQLGALVVRARQIMKGTHLVKNRSHRKYFHPLTMATPACPVCKVLVEMERSGS